MSVEIVFITHSTSVDNEAGLASGWHDTPLSPTGEAQALEVRERYRDQPLAAVYAADLARTRRTAEVAFGDRELPICLDARLRECDYGDLTRAPRPEIDGQRVARVADPHPGGESYEQAAARHGRLFDEIARAYPGDRVVVVGCYASWMALEHLARGRALEEVAAEHRKWQPGWRYTYGE